MLTASSLGLVSLPLFIDTFLNAVKDPSSPYILTLFIQVAHTGAIFEPFLSSLRISKEALLSDRRLLFHLLTCKPVIVTKCTTQITITLFPRVNVLSQCSAIESALTNPTVDLVCKDYKTTRFATDDDLQLLTAVTTLKLRFGLCDAPDFDGRAIIATRATTIFPPDPGFDQRFILQVFTQIIQADTLEPDKG
jgi:hypothetical protein